MAEVPAASSSRYQTPPSDPAKTNTILSAIATPFGKILAADAAFQPGGTLEDKRKAILRAVGDIPIVTSEFFFDSVLSWSIFQARPELLDEVEQELINNQHLANGSWVEYPVDPNYMQGTEDIVFAGLSRIMDAISVATRTVLERYNGTEGTGDYDATTAGLRFLNTPHANPKGERLNATRPDGSGVLTEADWLASKILDFFHLNSWFVMGVPSEFKKKRKLDTILDNMKKVFWSVTHIFANDPARRFTYAFTAEDASMIMWFMSRSQIMASERFNFRSSPKQLIRLVAALALASPEQLGFDPTVSQCRDAAGIVQYKIEVDGKYYSTIGTVSDYLADDLRGRGTRVLLVHPEGDPTTVLTLKDTWMMADSVPEGELLHLIHKLLENEPSDAGRHPSQFFLSVERDGFVLLADGTPDTTEKIMGGKMIPLDSPHIAVEKSNGKAKSKHQSGVASASLSIRQSGTGTVRGSSKGFPSLPPPIPAPIQTKRHDHRKHYRLVTNEVGQSIDELTSLCQILHALADIVKALKIFHGLGLVHRDLSPGNILVVDGIARLTDLEHTKVFRSDARAKEIQKALLLHSNKPKGDKNANYDFMAVEAQDGRYKFCPAFRCDPKTGTPVPLKKGEAHALFIYNPCHDLEMTLWILFFSVLRTRLSSSTTPNESQNTIWDTFFNPQKPRGDRADFIRHPEPFLKDLLADFAPAVKCLIDLCGNLFARYTQFETTFELDHLELATVHDSFIEAFTTAASKTQDIPFHHETEFSAPISRHPDNRPPITQGRKRQARPRAATASTSQQRDGDASTDDDTPLDVIAERRARARAATASTLQQREGDSSTDDDTPLDVIAERRARARATTASTSQQHDGDASKNNDLPVVEPLIQNTVDWAESDDELLLQGTGQATVESEPELGSRFANRHSARAIIRGPKRRAATSSESDSGPVQDAAKSKPNGQGPSKKQRQKSIAVVRGDGGDSMTDPDVSKARKRLTRVRPTERS